MIIKFLLYFKLIRSTLYNQTEPEIGQDQCPSVQFVNDNR